ncbi:MAG: RcnB family protein [Sphingomonadaceae bacterium]
MKTFGLIGVALAVTTIPSLALAGPESAGAQFPRPSIGSPVVTTPSVNRSVLSTPTASRQINNNGRNWGPRANGRWLGGYRAPGGWPAYRPLARGFILPSYWINPGFFIGNYARYGFSTPRGGYGWSRYYDDAVLTDRNGRVYDSVRNVDWDRYDRYDGDAEDYSDSYGYRDDGTSVDNRGPEPRARDRDQGLGGAIIGGAVGAVAGNVIGGRGNRLAGSLIGGGVAALAGAAIDRADNAGRGPKVRRGRGDDRGYDRDYGYDDGRDYDRRDRDYDRSAPHWQNRDYRGGRQRYYYRSAPSYAYSYAQPTETVITTEYAPVTTTKTYVTETVTYASAPRKRYVAKKRYWKPKPRMRSQCVCGS